MHSEAERKRIEQYNPNPKMPLVRFVGGTWRVGGLLALSRAFGDAYMKVRGFLGLGLLPAKFASSTGGLRCIGHSTLMQWRQ